MNAHAYFTTLAHDNVWATRRLLDLVDALPEADDRRECGLFFKNVHGTLNHLLVAEPMAWFPCLTEGVSNLAFAAALGHVFNHGTHHRGQISAAITAMGHAGPEIDGVWMLQAEARAT